jgi:ribonuclease BN (tRNA processing enzyme)
MLDETKVVLLGTGTPNACYNRSGPSVAIVANGFPYIVDFGPGVVRQASKAYKMGIKALHPERLDKTFLTHLHSDHSVGLPDLIFTPWVLERKNPLTVFGPNGVKNMVNHILKAYQVDVNERINGLEHANKTGGEVNVVNIKSGLIYKDENVEVEAIPVIHGGFESYAFKFTTSDKKIVVSGDTSPCEALVEAAKGCDILVHEVYSGSRVLNRDPKWKKYHTSVHTSTYELGELANRIEPGVLVLYHQLYMVDVFSATDEFLLEVQQEMIKEIQEKFKGKIIFGNDLDII